MHRGRLYIDDKVSSFNWFVLPNFSKEENHDFARLAYIFTFIIICLFPE